jgi:hypothetical protein
MVMRAPPLVPVVVGLIATASAILGLLFSTLLASGSQCVVRDLFGDRMKWHVRQLAFTWFFTPDRRVDVREQLGCLKAFRPTTEREFRRELRVFYSRPFHGKPCSCSSCSWVRREVFKDPLDGVLCENQSQMDRVTLLSVTFSFAYATLQKFTTVRARAVRVRDTIRYRRPRWHNIAQDVDTGLAACIDLLEQIELVLMVFVDTNFCR